MARKKAEEKEKDDKALSEKEKMLDLALKQIQKDYGDGAVMKLGENFYRKFEFGYSAWNWWGAKRKNC